MEARTSLEVIAPSIEEAIAKGLSDLGLNREQVDVEVLDSGARGLFGLGIRQARVRLSVRTTQGDVTFIKEEISAPPPPADTGFPNEELTAPGEANQSEALVPAEQSSASASRDLPNEIALHVASETVSELLEKMRVDAQVTAEYRAPDDERSRPTLWVDVHGQDLSILIGPHAETLNALESIAALIINKELGRSVQLTIDVEGYRVRRVQQLRQMARRMADQAIKTGRRQVLEPMPASDRRIIHIELRNNSEVTTESIGEEPHRKVTILPK